eukprot:scaffold672_cov126-Cylindrotheca_fusiformis.AAC.19
MDCFTQLELQEIDWTGVTPDTTCDSVIAILNRRDHCKSLASNTKSKTIFCNTFESCVVWEGFNDDDDMVPSEGDEGYVNCTALTQCDWPGIHPYWLGDGICHDNIHGCYNTAICGFDGGDCCEDTCADWMDDDWDGDDVTFAGCGHDGFACRDPQSEHCDPKLTYKCRNGDTNKFNNVTCPSNTQKYRLIMYDSFGDGWDSTKVVITDKNKNKVVFNGGLKDGATGLEPLCLAKDPTCYSAVTNGGMWGVESSWEIKPLREGGITVAGSGAPNVCEFSVVGDACEKTCTGRPDIDPTDNPDYKNFKEMYECIEDKCLIQLDKCQADPLCEECFKEDSPEYCFGVDTFVAVIDCSVCKCTDRKTTDYCASKPSPGGVTPSDKQDEDVVQQCTSAETMAGTKAVMAFSKCSQLDSMYEMVTEFDQENFGVLDVFERCAHSFADEKDHGGFTALGCMQILSNAVKNPPANNNANAPREAISALANHLYNDGESFCNCAKKASDDCPLCPNFQKFKTLLYESMDACKALDEIDCDSWREFWKPCQENLFFKYGSADFGSKEQCKESTEFCGLSDYAKFESCGGVGPFPAFRRLDCDKELSTESWDFYSLFQDKCLEGDDGIPPTGTLRPVAPTPAPMNRTNFPTQSPVGKPTPKPYIPPDASPSRPYIPPTDPTVAPAQAPNSKPTPYVPSDQKAPSGGGKKKSHWFRNLIILCLLGAGGYYVYKKRFATFNFVQYRRRGGAGGGYNMMYSGESEMFSNLNSSTTFEPPSLPPTPAAMGTEMT